MMQQDDAALKANSIVGDAESIIEKIKTEEDTKLQIITRFLTECLGWKLSDIGSEVAHSNGFSDYLIQDNDKARIIVEAKRLDSLVIGSARKDNLRILKLNGSGLSKVLVGVEQAASYAQPNGIPIAVLTDGVAWIIFKPYIADSSYLDYKAFVFPSLNAVINDFSTFFELLGKSEVQNKTYNLRFDEIHNERTLLTDPLISALDDSMIKIVKKSVIAFDLERVFEAFFSRMKGEDDPDLLIECFVDTRESRIADFSLEKMTTQLLGNISPLEGDVGELLSKLVSDAVELDEGESVFIVGPTGAGKTTFLDRFFRKTLSLSIREKCTPIRINCLDATGSTDTVISWMVENIIEEIETQLFEGASPSWDDLMSVYFSDYQQRSNGIDSRLYKNDKDAFLDKFTEFMDEQQRSDREGYLKKLLTNLVNNRKKLPVFVIDNTDEFNMEYKVLIFQFVQSIRRHIKHCLIIHPVTDKSAWTFSKTDIFGIYKTKSFFLPTPPPREVFRKRIDYLRKKLAEDSILTKENKYISKRGIKVSIPNLEKFADVLEGAFVNHEHTAKTLGELSNYNIRRTLRLSQRIITSSVFNIEDILVAYTAQGASATNSRSFMSALLKGDYEAFKADDTNEVTPIFQVNEKIRQSPLQQLRILALLNATANAARDVESRHLNTRSIHNYFDVCNVTEAAIDSALLTLTGNGLVEHFDPSISEISSKQRLAITYSGKAHLNLALRNHIFFEQMAITTAITDEDVALKIRHAYKSNDHTDKKFSVIRSLFAKFLIDADTTEIIIPNLGDQFECQRALSKEIAAYNTAENNINESNAKHEQDSNYILSAEIPKKDEIGIIVTVDWFSEEKGFGFGECAEIDGGVFIHQSTLKAGNFEVVRDGDDLLCDVEYVEKGPKVSVIHEIQTNFDDVVFTKCLVVRLFPDRYYGFVRPLERTDDSEDAFFHFSLMIEEDIQKLKVGDTLEVEINSERSGNAPQVRQIVETR